jgi:ABC-2 type transport system ATP-binding protein
MSFALEVQALNKSYAGVRALQDVSLEVEEGDFFALLGPNGAGKSTLIGVLCSLVRKNSGQVRIFGNDIDRDFALAKQNLGVVPQEFNFNNFETCRQILLNQAGYFGVTRSDAIKHADFLLEKLGLWDKRDERSRSLSGGMKRRLMIARAMIHKPRLLVLDEPTAGVDIELRRTMWEFIKEINEQGTTIILTTHYLEEAESLCRNVAIINHGQVVERSDMRSLLAGLQRETFVLDLDTNGERLRLAEHFELKALDDNRIEVTVDKNESLNPVFSSLAEQDVNVLSMRNKVNRLEELFVHLTKKGEVS